MRSSKVLGMRQHLLWFALGLVWWMLLACVNIGPGMLPVNEPAPDFALQVGDESASLADYRGQVVVINFWSSA